LADESSRRGLGEPEQPRPEQRDRHRERRRQPEADERHAMRADVATLRGETELELVEVRIEQLPRHRAGAEEALQYGTRDRARDRHQREQERREAAGEEPREAYEARAERDDEW